MAFLFVPTLIVLFVSAVVLCRRGDYYFIHLRRVEGERNEIFDRCKEVGQERDLALRDRDEARTERDQYEQERTDANARYARVLFKIAAWRKWRDECPDKTDMQV